MNLETKITIYKFTPQLFTLTLFKILQKNVNYKAIGISMDWQNEPL